MYKTEYLVKQKVEKVKQLKEVLGTLLDKLEVQQYLNLLKLPYEEQKSMEREWDVYFDEVREGPIYALFREQKEALDKGDLAKAKDALGEIRQAIAEMPRVPKPRGFDPKRVRVSGEVNQYLRVKEMIETLEKEISTESDDAKDLFRL